MLINNSLVGDIMPYDHQARCVTHAYLLIGLNYIGRYEKF